MDKYINIIISNTSSISNKKTNDKIEKIGKDLIKKKKCIEHEVFTDGSCIGNNRKSQKSISGYGVFWGDNDQRNLGKPFTVKPLTNNRSELYAIYMAIKTLSLMKLNPKKKHLLIIYSDSQYCIKTLTSYIKSWRRCGWKKSNGKTPLNLDLILKIDSIANKNAKKFDIKYIHVRAHKSQPKNKDSIEYYKWYGNNKADFLAKKGGMKSIK
tara:strand:+ start:682 stop:1314 length:633 start_codon:yes stop_codon:yes gene_type:complete